MCVDRCLSYVFVCDNRWLYKEATVQEVEAGGDDCIATVKVVISAAAYGRYRKLFQTA